MTTRVLIPCAGNHERWDMKMPKHLVPICKEPILERQVRLIKEHDPKADVRIVVPDLTDDQYKITGTKRAKAKLDPERGEVDKVASSKHLWNKTGDTIISWGDVWYEREVLDSVLDYDTENGWQFWGTFLGDGGELFAFKFGPDDHATMAEAIDTVAAAHAAGEMKVPAPQHASGSRGVPGGWGLYRALNNRKMNDHKNDGRVTLVNGWTDDFDAKTDWDRWCLRYAKATPAERERRLE